MKARLPMMRLAVVLLLGLAGLPRGAQAYLDWAAAVDGLWQDPARWIGTTPPVRFRVAGGGQYTVSFGGSVTTNLLEVGNGNHVTFDLNQHAFTAAGGDYFQVLSGEWLVRGGTLNLAQRFSAAGVGAALGSLVVGEAATVSFTHARFQVGTGGRGLVQVQDGGVLYLRPTGWAAIGQGGASVDGTMIVTGAPSTVMAVPGDKIPVYIGGGLTGYGAYGTGSLHVVDGGSFNCTSTASFYIGSAPDTAYPAIGQTRVNGYDTGAARPASLSVTLNDGVSNRRRFLIGASANAEGRLTVEDGGLVEIRGNSCGAVLGAVAAAGGLPAAQGLLEVATTGSVTTAMSLGVGGDAEGVAWVGVPGGRGVLRVASGGTVDVAGRLYVFDGGEMRIDGGRIAAASLMLTSGARLKVSLGARDPVNASVAVSGEVRLHGNALEAALGDGFVYHPGDVYRIVAFGSLNATFNRFSGVGDGDTLLLEATPRKHEFQLNYGTLAGHETFITLKALPPRGMAILLR